MMEKFVEKLGAVFNMAELGMQPEICEDHTPDTSCGPDVLRKDCRILLAIAANASDA